MKLEITPVGYVAYFIQSDNTSSGSNTSSSLTTNVKPVYIYESNKKYPKNVFLVSPDYSSLYLSTKDFTSTDIRLDLSSGNIIRVFPQVNTGIARALKQVVYENVKSGSTYIIELTNKNPDFNRYVSVLQKQQASVVSISPFSFDENDRKWDYDEEWVLFDSGVQLKTKDYIALNSNNDDFYLAGALDITKYSEILKIDVYLT